MCDCLVAVGSGGAPTLFAKNSDRPPGERQVVEWFGPRRGESVMRATHIEVAGVPETVGFVGSRPTWAWGVEHGVNSAWVAVGNEAIYTTLDPRDAEPGLPGIDLVRLALERSTTAAEAVAVITSLVEHYGQGGSGHEDRDGGGPRPYWSSFLVADPGAAFVIETSGREWEVEAVPAGGRRAISNRTTIPSFDARHRHPRQPVERLVDPRWEAGKAALAAEVVTAESLMAHLRSHAGGEDGWTVCMHVEGVEATTAAMVAELPGRVWFCLGSPCQSAFVEREVGPVPT